MDRRKFVKIMGMAGVAAALPVRFDPRRGLSESRALAFNSPPLQKFIQALPGLGPTGIPVAAPNVGLYPGNDYYQIKIRQYTEKLHPALPATRLWGYADATDPAGVFGPGGALPPPLLNAVNKHLGPVIVAQRNRPVRMTFYNELPATHILPVDLSIMGADQGANRAAVHIHGGHVPWFSDGGPHAWFDPAGNYGLSAKSGANFFSVPDMPAPIAGTFNYYYPNDQSARLMWYHDHALGITRLNAYAGIASGYLVTDAAVENVLVASGAFPSQRIPLVFQDKIFKPTPDAYGGIGDLDYPYIYDPAKYAYVPPPGAPPLPVPSVVPEMFGDTMLVNGKVFPFVKVEPRRYRITMLNACQSRFLRLRLLYARGNSFPRSTEPNNALLGPQFLQIGSEGGFLDGPTVGKGVVFTGVTNGTTMLLAPAERADIIIDFSLVPVGAKLILVNNAPGPFPGGAPGNDYYPGNPLNPVPTQPGFGPNTRTLLQFRVVAAVTPPDPPEPALWALPPSDPAPLTPWGNKTIPPVTVRNLTLNEDFDGFGRLLQLLGTNVLPAPGAATFGRAYSDATTEVVAAGATEVWNIFNLTADTHPIHFHLVNVQVVQRRKFDPIAFYPGGVPTWTGPARKANPNEMGWKETVQMAPGECTSVIMKFDLPVLPPAMGDPLSPRTGNHEYVWHCHILEHEEHDMMRPLEVV